MRLLLDTHILLAAMKGELAERHPEFAALMGQDSSSVFISVASIWEIAIKTRLGKLDTPVPIEKIGDYLGSAGYQVVPIELRDVIVEAAPVPETRDPFDRLLLAQCAVEGMRLVTIDRTLVGHPYAVRS